MKYAFRARNADPLERNEIADKRGARWSALNELPGWMPARDSRLEFMHATFLGLTKHVVQEILVGGGLFVTLKRGDKPLARVDTFLRQFGGPLLLLALVER